MSPRQRTLALIGLAAGLWAVRNWLDTGDLVDAPPARPARSTAARPAAAPAASAPLWSVLEREALDEAGQDPFALPRAKPVATPQRPAPVVVANAPVPAPAASLPAPVAAPLRVPYRFVGLMTEQGQPSRVYLALGDQLLEARPGDVLEGGYQLQSIALRELVFLNTRLNQTVRMPVDGETS